MHIPWNAIYGGILLGTATGLYLLLRGKVLGCSGILYKANRPFSKAFDAPSLSFVIGLLGSGLLYTYFSSIPNPKLIFNTPWPFLLLGGFFVGLGTRLANGCTSGHGLCGLSMLRTRSIVAVTVFFSMGILSAWLFH